MATTIAAANANTTTAAAVNEVDPESGTASLFSLLQQRVDSSTEGLLPYSRSLIRNMSLAHAANAEALCDFIEWEQDSQNIKKSTKATHIKIICWLDKSSGHRPFGQVTKRDILNYLGQLRKPESEDPTHKWIGTYNTRQMVFSKFFRWLYNRKDEPDSKKWLTPPCLQGVKPLPRKEKSPYKPSDIWTNEEHAIFLKYCPEKRDRRYHSMANDTSARPHELLSIRIKDIVFKVSSSRKQYAEVHIKESKTRPRTLPLIFSIPYVKDWMESHPMAERSDAFLFISLADSNFGKQLSENALYKQYTRSYKQTYFTKLVDDASIPDADKAYMRNMLTKPWNPYIQRHSALTAKSQVLKESTLRDHAGWTMSSRMPSVYLHYFGNESSKSLLEAYGVENYQQKQNEVLNTKSCPHCKEVNKSYGKFCTKCRMVLSYDAYGDVLAEKQHQDSELDTLRNDVSVLKEALLDMKNFIKEGHKFRE